MYNRFKKTNYNPDELIDYDTSSVKLSIKQYYKQKVQELRSTSSLTEDSGLLDYKIEYTEKGLIKRPQIFNPSTGQEQYIPVTMDLIRSVILNQHCRIIKSEELVWFEDGLKWLSQQQYQNTNQYKYIIHQESNYTEWDEKRRLLQYDIEDLERACEAYFGIPLALCENNWAAKYLMTQATKGNLLRRMKIKSNTSINRFKFSLKKLFCFN